MEKKSVFWTYFIFFVFGWAGLHRLYMGKWLSGLVWFLTGALLGLGWLYDLFTIPLQVNAVNCENNHS